MCLRVLQVVGSMNRGGAETLLMNLYRKMDREKVQFDFVVHDRKKGDYDDEIKALGGKIYYMPHYNVINHLFYVKEWHQFFLTHPQYPIIHGHMRSTAAIYLKMAKKYNRTAIAHSHGTSSRGNVIEKFVKALMQYPIRYTADYFFACSKEAGIWLFGSKICQSHRFKILNNAIDSSQFIFSEDLKMKKSIELEIEQRFVIGHVGNFDTVKNHAFLLEIFNCVCKKEPTCRLLLVGAGNSSLQKAIKEKVEQKGLSNKVQFLGKRTDVHELLNIIDVFVFPSLHEGLPVVIIEAQANGLMCLLSDTISKEVAITENVEFISLKRPAEFWAERILFYKNNYERKNMQEAIKHAGYDINRSVQWLTKYYLTIVSE
ncbi:MAG: glycosyltransferase family 1 protein [Lachnospiraceae bacterium]|nr:glycosyltransferase family 1 protein [Lachnospiraceae bacterium]